MDMSRASAQKLHEIYGVDEKVCVKAFESLDEGLASALAFSGKIASGKDTVGESVMMNLPRPWVDKPLHMYFAYPLKKELTNIILLIKNSLGRNDAILRLSDEMKCSLYDAQITIDFIYKEVITGVIDNGYSRTAMNRRALQYWATEVRREHDDLYWVRQIVHEAMVNLAQGRSVFLTDTRFPNEAKSMIRMGATLVRLDVSSEEQERRLLLRDDVRITAEARAHSSELALDNFGNFHYRIMTDNYLSSQETSAAVLELLNQ